MDEKDILESEVRVTLLGDKGKYSFDWVDKDERKVKFVPDDSDFDGYNSEVKNLLNKQGILINNNEYRNDVEDDSQEDSKFVDNNTQSDNPNDTEDSIEFEPVNDPDEDIEQDHEFSEKTKEYQSPKKQKSSETKEYSFVVRMSDSSNRREVIDKIRDKYPDGSDKLALSGPYEVTYRFNGDGTIEFVRAEDIGIDQKTND